MPDEPKIVTDPESKETAKDEDKTPVVDPYADLSEEEREAAQWADESWKKLAPKERTYALRLAIEAEKARLQQPSEPKKVKEETPAPARETAKAEGADAPPTWAKGLMGDLEEIKKANKARDEKEQREELQRQALEEHRKFNTMLNRVMAENEDLTDDEKELLREGFYGEVIKNRPANIEKAFRARIERHEKVVEERANKHRQGYVRDKLASTKATRGETTPGPAKGSGKEEATVEDLNDGTLLERLKRKFEPQFVR